MHNWQIFCITAVVVALIVWGWMKLAYIGRPASPTPLITLTVEEKRQQMLLEVVLVVVCILLFLWWKQP